ncbi:helix-turn-helix domain-containing protein [Pseudaminobacter sp. NGMCC 1.201702]|uniref:helix-turn-helix domain-containing protein n=1 Tax=Pseudaminobacter sp. NGMCC 1.201702 TaxID=3391825 RepID=UPI0039EE99BE
MITIMSQTPYMALDILSQKTYIQAIMTSQEFKLIRTRLGLTQAELASVLGYASALQISSYERATNPRPVPQLLALLMKAYDEGYRPRNWPRAQ